MDSSLHRRRHYREPVKNIEIAQPVQTFRPLSEEAYDVFAAAASSHALKVVLEAAPVGHELLELHEVPVTA